MDNCGGGGAAKGMMTPYAYGHHDLAVSILNSNLRTSVEA